LRNGAWLTIWLKSKKIKVSIIGQFRDYMMFAAPPVREEHEETLRALNNLVSLSNERAKTHLYQVHAKGLL
jgi:hypothetical protein